MNLSKKHQLKNYLRIIVLLLGVSVLLWNCEKEEEVVFIEQGEVTVTKPTIEILSFEEAVEEKTFTELNNSYNLKLYENNEKYKGPISKTLDSLGVTIETSTIKKIVSENYVSYTMLIVEPQNTSNSFYNLVIQEHKDKQEIFTVKYTPDVNATLSSTASFVGDIDMRSGMDPRQLWGDDDGDGGGGNDGNDCEEYQTVCNYMEVWVPHGCTCANHMPSENCWCPSEGGEGPYYTIETQEECKEVCIWENNPDYPGDDTNDDTVGGGDGIDSKDDNIDTTDSSVATSPILPDDFDVMDILSSVLAPLSASHTNWLNANPTTAKKIVDFLGENKLSQEAINEAKLSIEVFSQENKFDYTKKGTYKNRPSLKYKAVAKISNGTTYLLETGEQLFVSNTIRQINKSAALFQTSEDNGPYYYMHSPDTERWYEFVLDDANPNCLSCDLEKFFERASLGTLKLTGRYILPVEDIKILFDGKDFDNVEANRMMAAGFLLLTVLPGSKMLKITTNVVEALAIATKVGSKTIVINGIKGIRSFTSANFRHNLGKITKILPSTHQAHHVLPQKFRLYFSKVGINIDNPLFGSWWERTSHLKKASEYNDAWKTFFINKNPTQDEIFDFARGLAKEYNLEIYF